jgi:hypothetical protein
MKKALLIPILLIPLLVLNLIHLPHNRHNGVQIGEILENSTIFNAKIDYNMYSECPNGIDPIYDIEGFARYFITHAMFYRVSGPSWHTTTLLDDSNNRGFVVTFTVNSAGQYTLYVTVSYTIGSSSYNKDAFYVTGYFEPGITYKWKVICPKLNLTHDWGWIYITPCNPAKSGTDRTVFQFKLNGETISISPTWTLSWQKVDDYNAIITYTIIFNNANDVGKQFDELTIRYNNYDTHFMTVKWNTPLTITDVGDSIMFTINVTMNSVINT